MSQRKEYHKEWRRKNKRPKPTKWQRLESEYGLTEEKFQELLSNQNSSCAICKNPFVEDGKHNQKPQVDHCHSTMKVRGLLCGHCNMAIGKLKDSVELLESAIKYLKNS